MSRKKKTEGIVEGYEDSSIFVSIANNLMPNSDEETKAFATRHFGSNHIGLPFTVADYDEQRPAEADPRDWDSIFKQCDRWYWKNGIVRNIIDLMADFCVAGVQISSPDKEQQAVLRKWFEKVHGHFVSERIANMLYRLGNVGIRKMFAKVEVNLKKEWEKATAAFKEEIQIPDNISDERVIPYRYITISPRWIKKPSPEIAAFLPEPYYALQIGKDLIGTRSMFNDIKDDKLIDQIPAADIREALKTGKSVRLDNDKFTMLSYKKDDFDKMYAFPLIYSALSDLSLYSKMMLADRNVVDSAIKRVIFVKVGDTKNGLIPTEEYQKEMAKKITDAGAGGSTSYVVTQPFVDLVSDNGSLANFLGKTKFDAVLEAIYATFGIPSALTGTASGAAANNYMSMKVLIKKLEYVRKLLVEFWMDELKHVCTSLGYKERVFITFTYQELGDESAIKKLIQDMADRELISDETCQYMMGFDNELEDLRIERDRKLRKQGKRPPKAGPFHNANFDVEAKKILLQGGSVAGPDVDIDVPVTDSRLVIQTDEQIRLIKAQGKIDMTMQEKQGQTDIEVAKNSPAPVVAPAAPTKKSAKKAVKKVVKKKVTTPTKKAVKKQPGESGQGRPKNSRDITKRQQRTYKPRTK